MRVKLPHVFRLTTGAEGDILLSVEPSSSAGAKPVRSLADEVESGRSLDTVITNLTHATTSAFPNQESPWLCGVCSDDGGFLWIAFAKKTYGPEAGTNRPFVLYLHAAGARDAQTALCLVHGFHEHLRAGRATELLNSVALVARGQQDEIALVEREANLLEECFSRASIDPSSILPRFQPPEVGRVVHDVLGNERVARMALVAAAASRKSGAFVIRERFRDEMLVTEIEPGNHTTTALSKLYAGVAVPSDTSRVDRMRQSDEDEPVVTPRKRTRRFSANALLAAGAAVVFFALGVGEYQAMKAHIDRALLAEQRLIDDRFDRLIADFRARQLPPTPVPATTESGWIYCIQPNCAVYPDRVRFDDVHNLRATPLRSSRITAKLPAGTYRRAESRDSVNSWYKLVPSPPTH